jgi:glycosyltransferase involved in cell wall biosynthesis
MSLEQLTETHRPDVARGGACVLIARNGSDERTRKCVESVLAHTAPEVFVALVEPTSGGVSRALELSAPADVVLLSEPCLLGAGWLEAMRQAAYGDTTTASASALATVGTALALNDPSAREVDLDKLASGVAEHTMRLRPRLAAVVGPCVYLRRDALELVGGLDAELELDSALSVDFAQRCVLSGLAHVAADDVLVAPLDRADALESPLSPELRKRYPYLAEPPAIAASRALPRSLEAARRSRPRLPVTVDVRALEGAMTGTQRHILELVKALAATEALHLRLLTSPAMTAAESDLLGSLPDTELLSYAEIDDDTPPTTVFHRPQQVFGPADMRLALRLGERIVMSQLDLIAYRNPGYHPGATAWHSHRRVTRQALAAGDRIIVSSEHTRSELLSDGLVDDERVRIVPPGLDHMSSAGEGPAEPDIVATLPELAGFDPAGAKHPDGYLLCLGTDFRHKNRLFALRMLAALRERHDWRGGLVLAGMHIPDGSSRQAESEFVAHQPSLQAVVRDLGAIGELEKGRLMRGASAVVYPSVYEGFGLIPFEAALSGTPCAFASQSSLADVLPREAATILPWDPQESAIRLLRLLRDDAARARHLGLLTSAAMRHTWVGSAEAMVNVYREAAVAPAREAAALSRDELAREHELRELVAAQDELVARLVFERKHTQRMYDELNAQVGFGLSLIGPDGALPEDLQRALLALSARPKLGRPLYGVASSAFRLMRWVERSARR